MMGAPSFAHGQMRLYLLSLLADEPMHGYELMQAIERRFNGTYVPSAGTIYPRLAKLAEDGLVTKESQGRKTVYAITDAGRTELEARRDELDALDGEIESSVHSMADTVRADMRRSMGSIKDDLKSGGHAPRASYVRPAGARATEGEASGGADRRGASRRPESTSGLLAEAGQAVRRFDADIMEVLRAADDAGTFNQTALDELKAELRRTLAVVKLGSKLGSMTG